MMPIESSPLLAEAIGRTLIHSIWIGFMMFSLMKVILYTVPHKHSRVRYRVAGVTLLFYTITVSLLFFFQYNSSFTRPSGIKVITNTLEMNAIFNAALSEDSLLPFQFWRMISTFYLAGSFLMLLRSIFSLHHLHRIKKSGSLAGAYWSGKVADLTRRVGLRQKVTLLESSHITTPGLFGWLKPVIIMPAGMLAQMPFDQVEAILMHELYHLRRFDYLVNLLQVAAEGLFFYHPAVWMISRTMRIEREHCCDDLVLGSGNPPLLYARALAGLSHNQLRMERLATAASGPGQPVLYKRISRILNQQQMKTNMRERLLTLTLFFTGIAVMVLLNGFSSGLSIVKHHGSDPFVTSVYDTIPLVQDPEVAPIQEETDAEAEVNAEVDWEKIKAEAERAAKEASESIDWEAMKMEIEQAQKEVMEEIDWEAMKQEIEQAQKEVMEEIDWDQMRMDIKKSMDEINWDQIRKDMEQVKDQIDTFKLKGTN